MDELQTIRDDNGEMRKLGALPRTFSKCGDGLFAELEDKYLIEPSRWNEIFAEISPIVHAYAMESPHIDQKNQGSCTYSAWLHCIMQRRKEMGMDDELLAQCTGYAWDGINSRGDLIPRSRDDGMALDFACLVGRTVGGMPVRYVDPLDYKRNDWPENWKDLAYPYSADEWMDASRSMEHIVSSLGQGLPLLHGYAGHARMLVTYTPKTRKFEYKNTWGRDFGNGGFGELTWNEVDQGRKQYGAFVPITVRDPLHDGDIQ